MGIWIPIEKIGVSEKQRRKITPSKVEKHRIAYENGDEVCPIDVVAHNSENGVIRYRILGNGRHRFFGAVEAGLPAIECVIHDSVLEW